MWKSLWKDGIRGDLLQIMQDGKARGQSEKEVIDQIITAFEKSIVGKDDKAQKLDAAGMARNELRFEQRKKLWGMELKDHEETAE